MNLLALLALGAALLNGAPAWHDGDSGRLGALRVRLSAVDAGELPGSPKCEERRRAWACTPAARRNAVAARDRLRGLTGRGVTCRVTDNDAYGRAVVVCRLPDGRDPAAVLVREGLARGDMHYGGARYATEERAARRARLGVWAG